MEGWESILATLYTRIQNKIKERKIIALHHTCQLNVTIKMHVAWISLLAFYFFPLFMKSKNTKFDKIQYYFLFFIKNN